MPTYDYECRLCGHKFEFFQNIKDAPIKKCPACSKDSLVRLIGAGAGIIFKGSGFYCTDYRKSNCSVGSDAGKGEKGGEQVSEATAKKEIKSSDGKTAAGGSVGAV